MKAWRQLLDLRKLSRLVAIVALLVAVGLATSALAQSTGNFNLWWHVIAGGGGHASSADYALNGSIGQPATGGLSAADFRLGTGFWPGAGGATAPMALVVNTTDDTDDGTCDAAHCSLREALAAAGSHPGPDTITFNIPTSDPGYNPATGVWTIRPTITYNVPADTTVDGAIEPVLAGSEAFARPGIEIDGTTLGEQGFTGLVLEDNVTLRGLVINHFQYGIWIQSANVIVEGCYVGTDPTGTSAKPNGLDGILLIHGATGVVIKDNLISGNRGRGIRLAGEATAGNVIRDNRIGTTVDGTVPLRNEFGGIRLHAGAHDNTIGPGNLIAFNNWDGIEVDGADTQGNTITRNRIHSNVLKGIRLIDGANGGLAAPVITSVSATEVTGTACPNCVIEVFSDAEDEGAIYEGTTTADGAGNWTFTKPGGLTGPKITATATDAAGNTSEFAAPVSLAPETPTPTQVPAVTPTSTATATVSPSVTPTASVTPSATPTLGYHLYLPLVLHNVPEAGSGSHLSPSS